MKRLIASVLCFCLMFGSAGAEGVTLNILSGNEPYWEYLFTQDHPEIALQHHSVEVDGQAYITLLMTNDEYDVYELPVGPLYTSLKEKGYLLPLEVTDVTSRFTEALYPYLRPSLLKDNRLYGVPVPSEEDMVECVTWGMWAIATELWQEEGLGEIPGTYKELLEQMIDWEQNGGESAYRLIEASLDPSGFATAVFRGYVLYYERDNEIISFDTPIFREIMTLLKEYRDIYQPLDSRQSLILPYGSYLCEAGESGYQWMVPPAFEKDQAPCIPANITVYAINARTKHPQEACAYMEAALQSLNAPSLLMLVNQEAKEIKSGDWVAVTQEQAEQVQAYAAYAQMNTQSEFLSGDHYYDMENMLQQYLQGSLPLDNLISKLNQRAWMVMSERQLLHDIEPGAIAE